MTDLSEQINAIEKEIRETPYHKATEHHIGNLRARLARLKEGLERPLKSGGAGGYATKKQGDATLVLVGPPSVGKSSLINKLTNAQSKVATYSFTTVSVVPGMLEYKNAKIQILDVPGLIEGAEEGKGRGREVLAVIRGCDLVIIVSDVVRTNAFDRIEKALYDNGIRLNEIRPDVSINKKASGGITLHSNVKQNLDKKTIAEIARELGIKNAEITIKEKITLERLIDSFSTNRVYISALYVVNKVDEIGQTGHETLLDSNHDLLLISAKTGYGIENLKEEIWKALKLITVYLIREDEKPNFENPLVVKKNMNLKDIALEIGEGFTSEKTSAKIWGGGAVFSGQEVPLSKAAQDGMQIRFV